MQVLKKRADFVKLNRLKQSWITPGIIIQIACREKTPEREEEHSWRVGFTASRKIGNAVQRNFAKRRMRALAYHLLTQMGAKGYDYVLIARPDILTMEFDVLKQDLEKAIVLLHKKYDVK